MTENEIETNDIVGFVILGLAAVGAYVTINKTQKVVRRGVRKITNRKS
jgi:hypothetical protein